MIKVLEEKQATVSITSPVSYGVLHIFKRVIKLLALWLVGFVVILSKIGVGKSLLCSDAPISIQV